MILLSIVNQILAYKSLFIKFHILEIFFIIDIIIIHLYENIYIDFYIFLINIIIVVILFLLLLDYYNHYYS